MRYSCVVFKVTNFSSPTLNELEKLQSAALNTSNRIHQCREKIDALKEKIAIARDMVNRVG